MKKNILNSAVLAFYALFITALAISAQIPKPETTETPAAEEQITSETTAISGVKKLTADKLKAANPFDEITAANDISSKKIVIKPIEPAKTPTDEIVSEAIKRRGLSSGKWVIPDGATEYGVEIGFAPAMATWMSGPKYYDIKDRQHLVGSLRWGKILKTKGIVTFSWAIEIEPVNIAFGNEVDNPRYVEGSVGEPRRNREATYGIGINPASFRFIFFPKYRLRPMLGAGFGLVRHYKRVPTVEGTKFNFQVDFQIGGQYMLKENKALNFGYRYYHLSNMYLFNFNPGYNVNMFFVGYSIYK